MATGTTYSYNDSEYLFRLQTLIIDGGTTVLRNIFDQQLGNVPLNVFLANEKTKINRLRGQKIITTSQYDQLYPQGGQIPSITDFDITLITCLLRNLPSLGLNTHYRWNYQPQPTDLSTEADLVRLRGFRNEIAHITSTAACDQLTFQTKWNDIEQVLLRLNNGPKPVTNFQQTIDIYKNSSLDPDEEQRVQTKFEEWRELEKALESEINLVKEDMNTVKGDMTWVKEDVKDVKIDNKDVKSDVDKVGKDMKTVKDEITLVKEDVKGVKSDNKDVKSDVDKVGKDMKTVKDEITLVKEDVKGVKSDNKDVKSDVDKVGKDMKTVKDEITLVKEDVKGVKSDNKDVKSTVDKVGKDMKTVKDEITLIKEDVTGIKSDNKDVKRAVEEVETKVNLIEEDVKGLKRGFEQADIQQGMIRKVERSEEEDKNVLEILQEDLVFLYRARHTTTSLSPLMNNDAPLLKFFMKPDIVKVEEERSPGDVKENKTPLGPFRNIFYTKKNKPQCSTYLTADAGLGKTAYSKRLALAWCQAKEPLEIEEESEEKYFSVEEIEVIGEFRFLFLVLLRDSPADKCQIVDLILKQIIEQVNHLSNINRSDLENILAKEKCLIILDGLDEWSHPSTCTERDNPIPHFVKSRGSLTVLTTTRPWKLSIIGLKSSQIDRRLEITGLNNKSSNQLKLSVLSYFMCQRLDVSSLSDGDISKVKSDVQEFNAVVEQKRLSSLEKVPLLLMYMLFLWDYKMDLGETLCELYSSIVELLLSRALKTCESRDVQTSPENTPPYFRKLKHCSRFYTQLTALGRLAYETLLGKTKLENSLVFNSSIAEKYVGKDCLEFCFKTGIVSQSQAVQTDPLEQNFKVSFSHKTVQEFFAAIYMSTLSADNTGIMAESVIARCHCIQDILDMSKIFQFICGMNVQLAGCISQKTRGIIDHDVRTQEYRNTANYYSSHPLKDLQDMFVSGCKEMPRENEVSLCLQDLFIDERCLEKHYRESLRLLTTTNKQNIKSVNIHMSYMEYTPYNTVQKVLEYFTLNNLENVEKISCVGKVINDGVIPVLGSQVKCLRLSCWSRRYMSCSLCNTVRSLQKLEVIDIRGFKMSHSELSLLYDYISQRVCMRKIELGWLQCTDHKGSCRGPSLDLSKDSHLRELRLEALPLSELNIKMASLEKCHLQDLSLPARVFHPGSFGPANNKLNTSTVRLYRVRMAASVLTDLVNGVQALPQTVHVLMVDCTIESESEFETVKDQIKTSPYFKLLTDEKDRDESGELLWVTLEFETIKGGN